jgi:spore germination cell wall hydrolase CwlJ-like protein
MLKCWAKSAVVLFVLAQAVHADTTVSQSNDPSAAMGINLVDLFGREAAGLDAVEAGRMTEIITPPVAPQKTASRAATDPAAMTFDAAWINAIPQVAQNADADCLARAVYFEARGETIKGQAAVAEVVLNRVDSGLFPRTICGVVNQSGNGGCQFSFTCDGRKDAVHDRNAWYVAEKIASAFIAGAPRDLTQGATYFHTPAVRPSWSRRFDLTVRIGSHFFYRQPIQTAMN